MSINIDKDLVKKIADMAMLELSDEEMAEFEQYFHEMLDIFDVLADVPSEYELKARQEGVFHNDEVKEEVDYHDLWMRFSIMKNGYLLVPPIRGGEE